RDERGAGRVRHRERSVEGEGRALPRRARRPDEAAHALDNAPGNREAQSGATELAGGRIVRLFEVEEDSLLVLALETDAGVAHDKADLAVFLIRLGDEGDAAGLGELDGVSGKVEQHLTQACLVA